MKIVIDGAGEIGSHLARMLRREANEVTVIDSKNERINSLTSNVDVLGIVGGPSSVGTLRKAGVQNADLFIAVTPSGNQDINVVSSLIAKQLGAKKAIARVDDATLLQAENKLMFKDMGIDLMFYPEKIAADEIMDQLEHNTSAETLEFAHGKLQISVFKLDEDSPLLDQTAGQFTKHVSQAEDGLQFRVICISRGGMTIIPNEDTHFQYNDILYILTKREGLPVLMQHFGKREVKTRKAMIFGGSKIAEITADTLSKQLDSIKLIDSNKERCQYLTEALDDNVDVVFGDGRNTDFLSEENIKDYDAFIALTESDETNVLACVIARKFGVEKTIAEVENLEYIRLAEEMGVDAVINKKLLSAGRIFKFTLSGKARFVKYMSGTQAEVVEYTVAPGSAITKEYIKDLDFPDNAIIGGIIRGNEAFIAVGSLKIEPYDRVVVFSLPDSIKEADQFFR